MIPTDISTWDHMAPSDAVPGTSLVCYNVPGPALWLTGHVNSACFAHVIAAYDSKNTHAAVHQRHLVKDRELAYIPPKKKAPRT